MTHPQFRTEEKVNLLQNILGPHKYIFSPPTLHESSFNDLENSQGCIWDRVEHQVES